MLRFVRQFLLVLVCAAFTAAALLIWLSPDPLYAAQELTSFGRYSSQDALIRAVAEKQGVPPALVKALVWRESAFHADKVGAHGERGLMQVGEAAATDWARARKIETFIPTDLFDPGTNVEVGTWYLHRGLEKWKSKADPIPFALAEYNAGPSRVDRWIAASGIGAEADGHDLLTAMDIASTRRYVEDITARYKFYLLRGGR
jgi:soluble lytic murein transglycosylase